LLPGKKIWATQRRSHSIITTGGAEEAFAEGFSDLYGKTEYRKWPNIKAYLARKMKSVT